MGVPASQINKDGSTSPNPAQREAFQLISRFSAIMSQVKPKENKPPIAGMPELSPRQLVVLSHIVMLAPTSVSDLANYMNVSLATASQAVTNLAQLGFVTRSEDPEDHRRTMIQLSDTKGNQAALALTGLLQPVNTAIGQLGEQKFHRLLNALDELIELVEQECARKRAATATNPVS